MRTLALLAVLLSGCSSMSVLPDKAGAEWMHTSHPFAGPPFGPRWEEDTLDTIQAWGRWQSGRTYVEMAAGYKVADGGFYGPDLMFQSRVGVELWSR